MSKKRDQATAEEAVSAIQQVTAVDPVHLKREFKEIAGHLAHYNEVYADKLRTHLKAKRRKDETFARLLVEKRETVEEKLPMDMLKSMTEMDEEYEIACQLAIDAEVEKARAGGRCEALRAKKDALISLGAHVRAELGGDPQLREFSRAQDDE